MRELSEAIEHLDDILKNKNWECEECKCEHELLKNFLVELKEYREGEKRYERARHEQHQFSLEIAKRIVKTDTKAVANIILNMVFSRPTDIVSFCDIFELDKRGCRNKYECCTDCIDGFLRDTYSNSDIVDQLDGGNNGEKV